MNQPFSLLKPSKGTLMLVIILLNLGILPKITTAQTFTTAADKEYMTFNKSLVGLILPITGYRADTCKLFFMAIEFSVHYANNLTDSVSIASNFPPEIVNNLKTKLDTLNVNWQGILGKDYFPGRPVVVPVIYRPDDKCNQVDVKNSDLHLFLDKLVRPRKVYLTTIEIMYSQSAN